MHSTYTQKGTCAPEYKYFKGYIVKRKEYIEDHNQKIVLYDKRIRIEEDIIGLMRVSPYLISSQMDILSWAMDIHQSP